MFDKMFLNLFIDSCHKTGVHLEGVSIKHDLQYSILYVEFLENCKKVLTSESSTSKLLENHIEQIQKNIKNYHKIGKTI